MKKIITNWKFWVFIIAVIIVLAASYFYHRANRYKVLDRTAFSDFLSQVNGAVEEGVDSQEELSSFITDWAEKKSIDYKVDKAGNIIFDSPAIKRKKSVSPTVVIIGLNYKTASDNASLITSAAMIASTDLESGRKTVIFVNDENCNGKGYKYISKKILSDKAKVIYLDQGKKAYLSSYSFAETISDIKMAASKEKASLDTEVRIRISGIVSKEVSPENFESMPDPISAFGNILTRLKSKSIVYRISDFNIGSNENMYPDSFEAGIMLNSYSIESFTKYLDRQIKDWNRDYQKDNPDLSFTYEIIDEIDKLSKNCYDANTSDQITKLLYTITGNVYKFSENDSIPEGSNEGDYNGVNTTLDLSEDSSSVNLRIMSQGYNDIFLDRIVIDNRAAAELLGCSYTETVRYSPFENSRNSLFRTFRSTYSKVHSSSENSKLAVDTDSVFTPCSYLSEKNTKADIIHLRISSKSAANLTNTLMCYIKSKGNTFSL